MKAKCINKNSINDESGQALSEYGLILAIIVIGVIITLTFFRVELSELFNYISGKAVESM